VNNHHFSVAYLTNRSVETSRSLVDAKCFYVTRPGAKTGVEGRKEKAGPAPTGASERGRLWLPIQVTRLAKRGLGGQKPRALLLASNCRTIVK